MKNGRKLEDVVHLDGDVTNNSYRNLKWVGNCMTYWGKRAKQEAYMARKRLKEQAASNVPV